MLSRQQTHATLDLFSTSPTKSPYFPSTALQERMADSAVCVYNAPFFAYPTIQKVWTVTQGNCHHWDCPRCGLGRAKQEYGRMVEGCRTLGQTQPLYFITITCRGKEISHEYAEQNYLEWTNRFLDACRARAKRKNCEWHYVQVTERQRRLHPHSHFITTFTPRDIRPGTDEEWLAKKGKRRGKKPSTFIRSDWIQKQVIRSGLGEQYDISEVRSAEAASRYVAKYLFKSTIFSDSWPKGWKRIRYSQSFPKQEKRETQAIVLLSTMDWVSLSELAVVVHCPDLDVYQTVTTKMAGSDVIVRLK